MTHIDITALSTTELDRLASQCTERAKALRAESPGYLLAIQAGIRDRSYSTPRWGRIDAYEGSVIITMENGDRWKATGYGPTGNAHVLTSNGGISFRRLQDDDTA